MNKESGFIKLHRSILDSEAFAKPGLLKVWVWCLCKANHKRAFVPISTGKGETVIEVLPGQFVFGRDKAAKELNMRPSTVWDRMKKLKSMQNTDIQSDSHYSIVTVCNWGSYQGSKIKSDRLSDNQPTSNRQPTDTNKNEKNEKNEHIGDVLRSFFPFYDDPEIQEAYKTHHSVRQKKKAANTERAQKQYWKKLNELSEGNKERAIEIIDQSANSGWTGLYPISENQNSRAANTSRGTIRSESKIPYFTSHS